MFTTHCYKKKNSKEFIDFIQRVDSLYMIPVSKQYYYLYWIIYLSIHKAKKVKEAISHYYPRITLVFLPIKSPELLNLIEVRWMWLQRKAINNNNSTLSQMNMTLERQ